MFKRIVLLLLVLAACVPEVDSQPHGKTTLNAAERASCLAMGGRVGRGGLLPDELCFRPTADAGKVCSRAEDCSGFCLADTRSCSTVTPMFGCIDRLGSDGQKTTLCVD